MTFQPRPFTIIVLSALAAVILLAALLPLPRPSSKKRKRSPSARRVLEKEAFMRRSLSSSSSSAHDSAEEPVRMGSCQAVSSYGNPFEQEGAQHKIDPKDLPLNELLLHLDHPAYVSTPNPNGHVVVDIGLYVYEITDLDPGTNSFSMEGFLDLVWCDPRTKFNATTEGFSSHMFLEEDAAKELEELWWPAISFVNEVIPRRVENQEVIIAADGTIEYREKFGVQLSSNFDMERFPFDSQVLIAEIESFAWNSDALQFHIEEDLVGFSDEFDIPEHTLTGIEEHLETRMEPRDRHPFSELMVEVYVIRNPAYYITKVIIPLTLIVGISWAVFWMDGDALADRMAISFTGVLTSVAYQFIVSESLPRHIYNTFLDNFVLVSFIEMCLTVVVNVTVHNMYKRGYVNEAKHVDRICQIFFPIVFIGMVMILAGAQIVTDYLEPGEVAGVIMGIIALLAVILGYLIFIHRRYPELDDSDTESTGMAVEPDEKYTAVEPDEKYTAVKPDEKYTAVELDEKYTAVELGEKYTAVEPDEKYHSGS